MSENDDNVQAIHGALVEAALEEELGGVKPPDLAAAVMAAAVREPAPARRASGWWWLAAAVVLVGCGALLGSWWNERGWRDREASAEPRRGDPVPPSEDSPQDGEATKADAQTSSTEFYLPRDVADARRILSTVDSPDIQFHFVGPHRLPTASVMGPPAPTLVLGRWALGRAIAIGLERALLDPQPVEGIDIETRAHTIFVRANDDQCLRLALLGAAMWVDGLGTFRTEFELVERLQAVELDTRRQLGLVHRDELGEGLPNDLIPQAQRVLRPFGLLPEDVAKFAGLRELEVLDLRWCAAGPTVPFVQAVSGLASVRDLRLCELTDRSLGLVANMRLQRLLVLGAGEAPWRTPLRAGCGGVTDRGLDALLQLTALETLVLPGCRLSRAGLARLAELPQLATLVLDGVRPEGTESVWGSFHAHPNLQELRLGASSLATPIDLKDLAALPALQELSLDGCCGEQGAALAFLSASARLRRLSLGGWFPRALTEDARGGLLAVAKTPSLCWLSLPDCPGLRASDLLALGDAKQLETLVLSGTAADRDGLVPIEALAPLFAAIPGLTVITD